MLSGTARPEPYQFGEGFDIIIADDPDHEEVFAELWHNHEFWAEITQENGEVLLHIYPKEDGQPWVFPAETVERLLKAARCSLLGLELPDERPDVA